jgi:hypothetical protein
MEACGDKPIWSETTHSQKVMAEGRRKPRMRHDPLPDPVVDSYEHSLAFARGYAQGLADARAVVAGKLEDMSKDRLELLAELNFNP